MSQRSEMVNWVRTNFMIKNLTKILIPLVIIIAVFVAVELLYSNSRNAVPGALPKDEAAKRALTFINDVALQGQVAASLLETTEESGLYKIRLKIEEQEYESYVTKDAKLLFAQGTKITEASSNQSGAGDSSSAQTDIPKTDIPKVELFVMSYCPYGNQAEEIMKPVAELLKNKADIELHYVIYSNYRGGGPNYCLDKENKYCSMHGISELSQNIREFCVQKYQKDKVWSFIEEINSKCSLNNVDTCWEGIAKTLGINIEKIKTCQKNEGLNIAAQELALDQKYGISGSPQLIINGKEYSGSRTAEAYKKAICSAFNSQPEECSQVLSDDGSQVSGGCE